MCRSFLFVNDEKDGCKVQEEVPSPCVGACSLDGGGVCIGCFRSMDEITGWQYRSELQKLAIIKRCEERKSVI